MTMPRIPHGKDWWKPEEEKAPVGMDLPGWQDITKEGWFTPEEPWIGGSPYDIGGRFTGTPTYTEEAQIMRDFYTREGRLPTAKETSDLFSGMYGSPHGGINIGTDLTYALGSTPYMMGFRTTEEKRQAERFPFWTGRGMPAEGGGEATIEGGYYQHPGRELPDITRAGLSRAGAGGQKQFAPQVQTIQEFAKQNPTEFYRRAITDYYDTQAGQSRQEASNIDALLKEINLQVSTGLVTKEEVAGDIYVLNQQKREQEQKVLKLQTELSSNIGKIGQGVPVSQLPLYNELLGQFQQGANYPSLQQLYQDYLRKYQNVPVGGRGVMSPEQINAARNISPTPARFQGGGGGYGAGAGSMQAIQQQRLTMPYKPDYDAWVVGLGDIGENARVWLESNFPALLQLWQTHGQGSDYITWVEDYLESGGNLPKPQTQTWNTRRFAPPVSYSR